MVRGLKRNGAQGREHGRKQSRGRSMAPRAAWVVLAAALGAAAASLACAFLMPERVPEILGTPKEVIEAPVSTR